MSWIVRDLWSTLDARRADYQDLTERDMIRAYEMINRIGSEVGARWSVFIQLNFPPGRDPPILSGLGHRDLTILVHRDRKQFENVSQAEIKNAFEQLKPLSFDEARFGYEGFRVKIASGRIDCLPGGIHLWCEITPGVLQVLDWLFVNGYGLSPPQTVH